MKLRSGSRYVKDKVAERKRKTHRKYTIFRLACEDCIGQLNDSVSEVDRLRIMHAMHTYINNNKDNIYELILYTPALMSFITSIADRSVIHVKDLLYYCRTEPDLYISKTNGIEEARMVYELMNRLYTIVDKARSFIASRTIESGKAYNWVSEVRRFICERNTF
jgi:hypothetical protein